MLPAVTNEFLSRSSTVDLSSSTNRLLDGSPIVVNESQIHSFKFYHAQQLLEGMRYQDELYSLVGGFGSTKQFEAYNLAYALTIQNSQVVVSVSKEQYKVWVSLRSH